ncbi:MAG: hypothetical protein ACFNKE_04580 [Neisseria elongata]
MLWALWLWTAPLPPLCPLPQQENLRYGSADIRNPAEAAWSFAISAGQLPQCFGSLKPAARDGWTVYAAQMLRPHAYRAFDSWRKTYAVLLLLFSGCLIRRLTPRGKKGKYGQNNSDSGAFRLPDGSMRNQTAARNAGGTAHRDCGA